MQGDVWVVMLVEDREAVVSIEVSASPKTASLSFLEGPHTVHNHGQRRVARPKMRGSPASRGWACV